MAKKAVASEEDSVASQITAVIEGALGKLRTEKAELLKRVAAIDAEMRKTSASVAKQLGRYLPSTASSSPSEVPLPRRGRPKGAKAAKRTRKPMSEETKAKMRAAAKKRWAGKGKKAGGDSVGNG